MVLVPHQEVRIFRVDVSYLGWIEPVRSWLYNGALRWILKVE